MDSFNFLMLKAYGLLERVSIPEEEFAAKMAAA